MRIRVADALSLFPGPHRVAALRRVFPDGGVTRFAIYGWMRTEAQDRPKGYMPELRARQLVEAMPAALAYIEGPDGITPAERAAADVSRRGLEQGERGTNPGTATSG